MVCCETRAKWASSSMLAPREPPLRKTFAAASRTPARLSAVLCTRPTALTLGFLAFIAPPLDVRLALTHHTRPSSLVKPSAAPFKPQNLTEREDHEHQCHSP